MPCSFVDVSVNCRQRRTFLEMVRKIQQAMVVLGCYGRSIKRECTELIRIANATAKVMDEDKQCVSLCDNQELSRQNVWQWWVQQKVAIEMVVSCSCAA